MRPFPISSHIPTVQQSDHLFLWSMGRKEDCGCWNYFSYRFFYYFEMIATVPWLLNPTSNLRFRQGQHLYALLLIPSFSGPSSDRLRSEHVTWHDQVLVPFFVEDILPSFIFVFFVLSSSSLLAATVAHFCQPNSN